MLNTPLLIALIIICCIGAIAFVVENWPRTDEQRHAALLAKFHYENRHRSHEERHGELKMRVVAARLRRTISDHALTDPEGWREYWIDGVRYEVLQLAHHDKDLAKQFLAWAEKATTAEILYPDAYKVVVNHIIKQHSGKSRRPVHEDEIAALTVHR